MPAKSKAQQRLFAAAAHGATFAKAKQIRASTTLAQRDEFASGPMKHKPEHVKTPNRYGRIGRR
jgi:hypothetical protein